MLTVLIVDDEILARRGVAQGVDWERLGCRVAGEAANGEEGVALAEKLRPGLIITDIRMPRMDGVEMMNTLRARGCDAHVIVLTAYSDFPYVRGALKFGADDYLLKPFRNRELENAVQAICLKIEKSAPPPAQLVPLPQGEKSAYVQSALQYIAAHFADHDISITAIAEALSVSEGHLSHLFKKETGYTIGNYLTQYRVHMAMQYLRDCRNKVYEVAEKVGYRDVDYFGSAFKKLTGISPSDYQGRGGQKEE